MSDETHQQSAESSEKQLCIRCLAPNEPSANFCVKCGAPLGPYAFTGPFESQFAQGSAFRAAAERPRSFIVLLGMWLVFGALALCGIVFIALRRNLGYYHAVLGAILLGVSLAVLWKTTKNYLARKKPDGKSDA